eukprot:COSAG01_NODE_4147_length_5298_cov_4.390460_3_plen_269_part_00
MDLVASHSPGPFARTSLPGSPCSGSNSVMSGGVAVSHAGHVMSGWMTKKGGVRKNWLKRWFRLHDQHRMLEYYERCNSHTPCGVIPLKDVSEARKSRNPVALKGREIELVTPERIYCLRCEDAATCETWLAALQSQTGPHAGKVQPVIYQESSDEEWPQRSQRGASPMQGSVGGGDGGGDGGGTSYRSAASAPARAGGAPSPGARARNGGGGGSPRGRPGASGGGGARGRPGASGGGSPGGTSGGVGSRAPPIVRGRDGKPLRRLTPR